MSNPNLEDQRKRNKVRENIKTLLPDLALIEVVNRIEDALERAESDRLPEQEIEQLVSLELEEIPAKQDREAAEAIVEQRELI